MNLNSKKIFGVADVVKKKSMNGTGMDFTIIRLMRNKRSSLGQQSKVGRMRNTNRSGPMVSVTNPTVDSAKERIIRKGMTT